MAATPTDLVSDNLDAYVARKVFGMHGRTPTEQFCRQVVAYSGSHADYSTLTAGQRSLLYAWAVALGCFPPGGVSSWGEASAVAVGDEEVKASAREIAHWIARASGADSLAAALLPDNANHTAPALFYALGVRAYRNALRSVEHHDDADHSDEYERRLDRYDAMAAAVPATEDIEDGREARMDYEHEPWCYCDGCERVRWRGLARPLHLF